MGGKKFKKMFFLKLLSLLLLTLSANALEGCSSHFVLSVCLSVSTDLEDGGLLALQRDMNLKSTTIEVVLFAIFLKFGFFLDKK